MTPKELSAAQRTDPTLASPRAAADASEIKKSGKKGNVRYGGEKDILYRHYSDQQDTYKQVIVPTCQLEVSEDHTKINFGPFLNQAQRKELLETGRSATRILTDLPLRTQLEEFSFDLLENQAVSLAPHPSAGCEQRSGGYVEVRSCTPCATSAGNSPKQRPPTIP